MKKKIMMLMAVIIFGLMIGFNIIRGAQIKSIPHIIIGILISIFLVLLLTKSNIE